MIHNLTLVLLAVLAVAAAEPASRPVPVAAPAAPQGPALAYVSAPLVVGAQRGALAPPAQYLAVEPSAPAPRTLVAYTAATPASAQYFARTYNGLTTLTLEQRPDTPAAAPLVVAPAEPAPARYVYTEPAPAPARVVFAKPSAQPVLYATPNAVASQPARVLALTAPGAPEQPARLLAFTTPVAAPEPARVLTVTAQQAPIAAQVAVAPSSSSSQFFSRNYNGVPTVTYFVVGPSPVTAPVALAPQVSAPGIQVNNNINIDAGARPSRRPAPGAVPAGEPVNQGDVEVLDA